MNSRETKFQQGMMVQVKKHDRAYNGFTPFFQLLPFDEGIEGLQDLPSFLVFHIFRFGYDRPHAELTKQSHQGSEAPEDGGNGPEAAPTTRKHYANPILYDRKASGGTQTAKDPIGFAGGDTDLYGYCLNDPVNFIDTLGLSMDQIMAAYGWLAVNHPEVTRGLSPRFYDVPIPFFDGLYLGEKLILIDTRELNSDASCAEEAQSEILRVVTHELLHAQDGFLQTLLKDRNYHINSIYRRAEEIRQEYDRSIRGLQK